MRPLAVGFAVVAASVSFANPAPAAVRYTVTDLGRLGTGYFSAATGINDRGQVVGWSDTSPVTGSHAFLYDAGHLSDLGTLGGPSSFAWGINDAGQVVGQSEISQFGSSNYGTIHGFVYNGGRMTDLGTLGGWQSVAYSTNDAGQVAGYADTPQSHNGFLYSGGQMTDLSSLGIGFVGGINNSGWMTGRTLGLHAFVYDGVRTTDLGTLAPTGPHRSAGAAINAAGDVAGWSEIGAGQIQHAFLYTGGQMRDLGALAAGQSSAAEAINDGGQVVGWAARSAPANEIGIHHAFIYSDGTMTDLNTLIDPGSGWTLFEAAGINDRGQIVGFGSTPTNPFTGVSSARGEAFLLTPIGTVPEPASAVPLLLVTMPALLRRRP